jgi:hypothetical protein
VDNSPLYEGRTAAASPLPCFPQDAGAHRPHRGQYMITSIPTRQMAAPMTSNDRGRGSRRPSPRAWRGGRTRRRTRHRRARSGLIGRHDAVEHEDNGARRADGPRRSVSPPLPHEIASADFAHAGQREQGDGPGQRGHRVPLLDTPAAATGPRRPRVARGVACRACAGLLSGGEPHRLARSRARLRALDERALGTLPRLAAGDGLRQNVFHWPERRDLRPDVGHMGGRHDPGLRARAPALVPQAQQAADLFEGEPAPGSAG